MNQQKMGRLIFQLRKEKKFSQDALAKLLYVSREAISKWERGVTCPNPQLLLQLSEIFDISINELLYGERKNKSNAKNINNVTYNLYTSKKKNKRTIKILGGVILFFSLIILLLYFLINYNSVTIYEINKDSPNLYINNGVIVSTNEKIYFNLGHLKSDKEIKDIELYYKDSNSTKKFIMSSNNKNIAFTDSLGYEEYFDFKNKENLINNLCIKVTFDDGNVTDLRLDPQKFITNDYIFPTIYPKISNE